ncbi:MAG: glycosyltransferase, partial [Candidatus Levybacteria bacterium]|nr:glycosyltransferase [Candidatus Levybacteria bacterium]
VAHPLWAWQNMDGYFVGSKLVEEFLIQHGVNKDRIHISGIPLRKQFQTKIKKDEVRQKLEIPLDHKVVLIAAGTYKSVPVEKIIESLSSQIYAFAIILAGKKEENVVEYAGILKEYGVIGKVISYTDNMQDYMIASDLYVSKAGGLTVAECLALGLPALYLNNFPGHEVGNAEYAQSLGAAINLSQISDLKPTLIELLSDSQKLDRMSKNASKAAVADASSDIVSMVLKTQN